jgi:hypothetical protein
LETCSSRKSKYRQLADDQRQFAVQPRLEGEAHAVGAFGHRLVDAAVIKPVTRVALRRQGGEGPHNVFGGDRPAVVETRFGAQVEHDPGPVGGHFYGSGQQPVFRERLIGGSDEQRVEGQG